MNDLYNMVTSFLQDGGFFMYPIALVLALGLAISLERWVYLTRERVRNIKAFENFLPLLRTTDMEKMQMYSRESQAPVTRIIACGLDMMKVSKQRADIENSMNEGMLETMPRLEKRVGYLAVLANIATLLGLLGTVTGMIVTFQAITLFGTSDPKLMAGGISQALITTAAGLSVAIPAMISHRYFQRRMDGIVVTMEQEAVKLVDALHSERKVDLKVNQ